MGVLRHPAHRRFQVALADELLQRQVDQRHQQELADDADGWADDGVGPPERETEVASEVAGPLAPAGHDGRPEEPEPQRCLPSGKGAQAGIAGGRAPGARPEPEHDSGGDPPDEETGSSVAEPPARRALTDLLDLHHPPR